MTYSFKKLKKKEDISYKLSPFLIRFIRNELLDFNEKEVHLKEIGSFFILDSISEKFFIRHLEEKKFSFSEHEIFVLLDFLSENPLDLQYEEIGTRHEFESFVRFLTEQRQKITEKIMTIHTVSTYHKFLAQ